MITGGGNSRAIGGQSADAVSADIDMTAYDALPPAIRLALQVACCDLSARGILRGIKDGVPAAAIEAALRVRDTKTRAAWRQEVAEACAR